MLLLHFLPFTHTHTYSPSQPTCKTIKNNKTLVSSGQRQCSTRAIARQFQSRTIWKPSLFVCGRTARLVRNCPLWSGLHEHDICIWMPVGCTYCPSPILPGRWPRWVAALAIPCACDACADAPCASCACGVCAASKKNRLSGPKWLHLLRCDSVVRVNVIGDCVSYLFCAFYPTTNPF